MGVELHSTEQAPRHAGGLGWHHIAALYNIPSPECSELGWSSPLGRHWVLKRMCVGVLGLLTTILLVTGAEAPGIGKSIVIGICVVWECLVFICELRWLERQKQDHRPLEELTTHVEKLQSALEKPPVFGRSLELGTMILVPQIRRSALWAILMSPVFPHTLIVFTCGAAAWLAGTWWVSWNTKRLLRQWRHAVAIRSCVLCGYVSGTGAKEVELCAECGTILPIVRTKP